MGGARAEHKKRTQLSGCVLSPYHRAGPDLQRFKGLTHAHRHSMIFPANEVDLLWRLCAYPVPADQQVPALLGGHPLGTFLSYHTLFILSSTFFYFFFLVYQGL